MKAITPVHLGDKGADVSNLHKALLFLIVHESIEPSDIRIIREQLPRSRVKSSGARPKNLLGYTSIS